MESQYSVTCTVDPHAQLLLWTRQSTHLSQDGLPNWRAEGLGPAGRGEWGGAGRALEQRESHEKVLWEQECSLGKELKLDVARSRVGEGKPRHRCGWWLVQGFADHLPVGNALSLKMTYFLVSQRGVIGIITERAWKRVLFHLP